MRFGAVPVREAKGAILAHSESANGVRLRKGQTLEAVHIDALQAAGIGEVTVARLDTDELHEDGAADFLASGIVPDPDAAQLSLTKAFTGRVNITANGPGVVEMDVDALNAINAINPMITLATVPPWQQVGAGNMVGTVKIISYGVPKSDVERACQMARSALRLRPVKLASASLMITEIPGGAGEKGRDAIEKRLTALGMTLVECRVVPHQPAPLAEALQKAKGDLVLILTGSATSDPFDVAPEALREAGGSVERFGMPVDPGNLLFLGALDGRPVIGLPGCARSPALNGADWVLSRVACGVAVTDADIAAMGVGGLLKEIPTRPMPRERRKR
ncbi:molybdenum cofactor cytidylyltransferase [Shimia gijangensis]|uniref:Molybdenum cofactor cytidylyltransferase n=1 Tax=Shimia gijangensis TaxID=1470563 RepID=A0A1M6NCH6_9RHOB|nr:molybdopterin-binding protein [Shimia gijangensis]SHJ93333.1 molybdenum cofactor cytidylyltransferase [Shimia gijangensis]